MAYDFLNLVLNRIFFLLPLEHVTLFFIGLHEAKKEGTGKGMAAFLMGDSKTF